MQFESFETLSIYIHAYTIYEYEPPRQQIISRLLSSAYQVHASLPTMIIFAVLCGILVYCIAKLFSYLNRDYFILSACKRIKTTDGSTLESKVHITPGNTIFGNNFDVLNKTSETLFKLARSWNEQSKQRSYVLHFLTAPMVNIVSAEDVEQVLQSQELITKNVIYELIQPFLGDGLLISTGSKWHFRRKLLTPAFHFNILETFLEIFKEESQKFIAEIEAIQTNVLLLHDVIPKFTLNNICETTLGVKLDNMEGGEKYREVIHDIEEVIVERICNPLLYIKFVFFLWGSYQRNKANLTIAHAFSSKIIKHRRDAFRKTLQNEDVQIFDEYGRKKRYAMLDTLLLAESKGLINHKGICDEVNTFLFEGFDTTSTCLIFCLLNLAWYPKYQQKCFEELQNFDDIQNCSIFDFNKLEYLECFIKETLRLYPSVPFIGRQTTKETNVNGLILPARTQINIHTYDIMRDPKHFNNPNEFDPDRFKPENTTSRHPFAFIPFSAGPRNCIGQKFAMLEVKVLLVSILKCYILKPKTQLDDIIFENGMILRTQQKAEIMLMRR